MTDPSPVRKSSIISLNDRRARADEDTPTESDSSKSHFGLDVDRRNLSLVADSLFSDLLTDADALPHAIKGLLQALPPTTEHPPRRAPQDDFNGILVCSTNLMTSVDEAALRRFDYKVKFDYLRAAQANAFMHTCAGLVGMNLTLDDIQTAGLTLPDKVLTPEDFTVVLRQLQHDHESCTIEVLHAALMAEAQFRQSEPARKTGFM